jgi:hypothetical protein
LNCIVVVDVKPPINVAPDMNITMSMVKQIDSVLVGPLVKIIEAPAASTTDGTIATMSNTDNHTGG